MEMIVLLLLISLVQGLVVPPPPNVAEPYPNENKINPELLGGGFEGDILIPGPRGVNRGIAYNVANKWPQATIPYDISGIPNAQDRNMIEVAMQTVMYDTGSPITGSISRTACVYFRPRQSTDKTYLRIVHGQGCNAHLGYWANFGLTMTLQKDSQANCIHSGTIQHELLHVLGFDHEHSRPDRDNYVQINYGNIDAQWHHAFEKRIYGTTAVNLNTPYDYDSIMHYGGDYFSMNGRPTVVPKQNNVKIGNREKLSPTDILEVRRFYGCQA